MLRNFGILFILAFAFFLALPIYAQKNSIIDERDITPVVIRVAILRNVESLRITIWGPYEIVIPQTKEVIESARSIRNKLVIPTQGGIKLADKEYNVDRLRIIPLENSNIYINNRCFRGHIDIIKQKDLKLVIVNRINIEEYLYGVLYHEISNKWPQEALKAQAVIARTFALYQAMMNKDMDYDVTSDIYSQMYGGKTSEKFTATKAVNKTKAQVLTYNNKVFPTYYHATCGGVTEDAKNLWNINLPPLSSTKCNFCDKSPHFYWKKEIPVSDIIDKLNKKGFAISDIKDIVIASYNSSGRIEKLNIQTSNGTLEISGKDFRQVIGPNIIRSNNFKVSVTDDMVGFEGTGWGHGVGFCQWGAYFMSRRGYTYDQILSFYYPGASISKINMEGSYEIIRF